MPRQPTSQNDDENGKDWVRVIYSCLIGINLVFVIVSVYVSVFVTQFDWWVKCIKYNRCELKVEAGSTPPWIHFMP